MGKKSPPSIIGASHVPRITKGVYQVGTSVTGQTGYNQGPESWVPGTIVLGDNHTIQMAHADRMQEMEKLMLKEFYGDSMCGDCISIKVLGGHDRNVHERRRCQLCGTLWPGLEPYNDRRQAIADQKSKKCRDVK